MEILPQDYEHLIVGIGSLLSAGREKTAQQVNAIHEIQQPEDLLKDPFVLEFLNMPEQHQYLEEELGNRGDNEPVGILLGAYKDHILVEYATGGITNKVLLAKYQLYLPDKAQLESALNKLLEV